MARHGYGRVTATLCSPHRGRRAIMPDAAGAPPCSRQNAFPSAAMSRPTTLPRRELLRLGACGALGLSLPRLLRADARAGAEPAVRSCVLFLLHGGPSQLDVWDLKPAAPAEIRG